MILEGTVVQDSLGLGNFLLESTDERRFALKTEDAALLKPGLRVRVEGEVDEAAIGIGMTGRPVLAVDRFTVLVD